MNFLISVKINVNKRKLTVYFILRSDRPKLIVNMIGGLLLRRQCRQIFFTGQSPEDEEEGGERDGQDHAEDAAEGRAPEEDGENDKHGAHAGLVAHHPGSEYVVG